ncbi:MAG: RNA methyltransferase [Candidatus Vogelbacteria bacterium]|nr:RNA methyltransferase [Candidatus Vogelbacteria bacterium]
MKQLSLILHNIRSAYNVGAIFRTADAAGVKKIYLCGYTPTPANPKVAKTSLGAEKSVVWKKCFSTGRLIEELKSKGVKIVALEQTPASLDYRRFKPVFPLAVIVGNEVKGLSVTIIKRADSVCHIPMRGKKESLNAAVAAGVFIYKILE